MTDTSGSWNWDAEGIQLPPIDTNTDAARVANGIIAWAADELGSYAVAWWMVLLPFLFAVGLLYYVLSRLGVRLGELDQMTAVQQSTEDYVNSTNHRRESGWIAERNSKGKKIGESYSSPY